MFWIVLCIVSFISFLVFLCLDLIYDEYLYRYIFVISILIFFLFGVVPLLYSKSEQIFYKELINLKDEIMYKEKILNALPKKEFYTQKEMNTDIFLNEYVKYKILVNDFNEKLLMTGKRNKYHNNIFYIHFSQGSKFDELQYLEIKEF